ncbi:MAG TPA: response regulator [Pedobacter sp.]|jgi:DNA-binding response OmpR family regulator
MKRKVVVIERDKDILQIIETILNQQNYQVFSFLTELEALKRIEEIKPNAIILDVIKPSTEGTKLCKAIKKTPEIKDIPVIVLSTHFDIKSFRDVCADEIISKPFDIDELIEAVNKQTVVPI